MVYAHPKILGCAMVSPKVLFHASFKPPDTSVESNKPKIMEGLEFTVHHPNLLECGLHI